MPLGREAVTSEGMAPKFPPFSFLDRRGRRIEMREAEEGDAQAVLAYLACVDRESEHLSREPGEVAISEATERGFLRQCAERERGVFLTMWHAGQLVSTMDLLPPQRYRMGHMAEFGMSVRQAYWGAGLGKAGLSAMLAWAGKAGLPWVKLHVVATNAPAIALYRSLGFSPWGLLPQGLRLRGGRFHDIWLMGRGLGPGSPPLPLRPEAAEALGMPGGAWPAPPRAKAAGPELPHLPSPPRPGPAWGPSLEGPLGPQGPLEASLMQAILARVGPLTGLYLYGSRGRGQGHAASDWDLAAWTQAPGPTRHLAWVHEGQDLDLFVGGADQLQAPAEEADLRLLGGRWWLAPDQGAGEAFLLRVAALEALGPAPWSPEELELHRRWVGKMLRRLEEGPELGAGLAELRLAEWRTELLGLAERLRGWWPLGPAKGLARLAEREPELHQAYLAALAPGAPLAQQRRLAELALAPCGGWL